MKAFTWNVKDSLKTAMGAVFLLGTLFTFGNFAIDALVSINVNFSHALVEKLVCPAGSSLEVDNKAFYETTSDAAPKLLVLVLAPCVNGQGQVVRRGTNFNYPGLDYLGALGAYCLTTLIAEATVITVPLWLVARSRAGR